MTEVRLVVQAHKVLVLPPHVPLDHLLDHYHEQLPLHVGLEETPPTVLTDGRIAPTECQTEKAAAQKINDFWTPADKMARNEPAWRARTESNRRPTV
jgi:hypothetical protein